MSIPNHQEEHMSSRSSRTDIPDLEKGTPREHTIDQEEHEDAAKDDEIGAELEKHLTRKSTKKDDLPVEKYPLTDLDKGLVGWDSQDDPSNPRNFPHKTKLFILFLVSAITFLSPLASSIFAPGIPFVNAAFNNTSQLLGSFAVSVYVLGFAVGPLFLSPLSEIYGRCIVLNISNVFFCAFTLGCALAPNLGGLIAMRFFAGLGGSACLTIGTGVIADLFVASQRGRAVAMYSMGILFGPILGPICGGFIAQRAGWRWDMWVVLIVAVLLTAGLFIWNTETNHVVLLNRKTARLRSELERPDLQNVMNASKPAAALTPKAILLNGITRPLKMLTTQPIVLLCSLYMSFLFGLLFLLFTTLTPVFLQTYGWAPEMTGLAYLGIGIGNFLGIGFVAKTSDATIIKLAKRNKGVYEPEMRLPLCVFFGLLIPISFFWYGWTAYNKVHWIVPIISLVPFGFGLMGIFAPLQTYMIDCYPQYAASAIAGMTCLRCLFGAMLPLAGPSMYETLGLGWGNSMLGFIAIAFIPVPALLFKYGKTIREKYPIKF
ncbi:major facilitator superfamily domain-containing protein [Boeremia exigua]|uniref:major facilitator superfamily domain-containing protein n=1 Tax=Boeremia exigua TaxID=749465 RepID=UPI001E8E5B58|nr:major facilitator superfamily domain-containing protein [Boeremia exigua]KAH6615061.1 major facilitator superfamily domain-containing protein [Boeremia exigua]